VRGKHKAVESGRREGEGRHEVVVVGLEKQEFWGYVDGRALKESENGGLEMKKHVRRAESKMAFREASAKKSGKRLRFGLVLGVVGLSVQHLAPGLLRTLVVGGFMRASYFPSLIDVRVLGAVFSAYGKILHVRAVKPLLSENVARKCWGQEMGCWPSATFFRRNLLGPLLHLHVLNRAERLDPNLSVLLQIASGTLSPFFLLLKAFPPYVLRLNPWLGQDFWIGAGRGPFSTS